MPLDICCDMEVYIIRHTKVAVDKDICYGHFDVPLATTFSNEVIQLANALPKEFDAVYSSPSHRCKKLASALELQNVIFDSSIKEMNFGNWENKKWKDLDQTELNHWMADFINVKAPNGENLIELFERVEIFFDNLRLRQHKKVLIITHAGVIRCIWSYLLKIPLENIFKIPVGYNELFICELSKNSSIDMIKRIK